MPDICKIVVTDYIEDNLDWEAGELAGLPVDFQALQLKHAPVDDLVEQIKDAHVIIVNMAPMSADVLSSLEQCRLIIRHGVGYDNIDIDAATRLGIQVCYVPDYCQEEVAEQALLLLLAATRKLPHQQKCMQDSVAQRQWDFSQVGMVHRISGKKIGLIGCGRIGQSFLKMARGFDAEVLVCDPYLTEARQAALSIECLPLEKVLSESDFISIHCVLNDETRHIINETTLKLMKPEAILVNTARGGLVDSDALARACNENWIMGAAIDVYDNEPPAPDFVLNGLDNVLLTPHLSWYSYEAGWSIRTKIMIDVKKYLNGAAPRFPVNQVDATAVKGTAS